MKLGSRVGSKLGSNCCGNGAPYHHTSTKPCKDVVIKNITIAGDSVLVVLDDCTYLRAPKSVIDKSVCQTAEASGEE